MRTVESVFALCESRQERRDVLEKPYKPDSDSYRERAFAEAEFTAGEDTREEPSLDLIVPIYDGSD